MLRVFLFLGRHCVSFGGHTGSMGYSQSYNIFQLETLPREDLIKFAKKQMMLLQKAKARCTGTGFEITGDLPVQECSQACSYL